MATNGPFYWPSVGIFVAAYGQFFMAANNRRRTPLTAWFAACWMFAVQKTRLEHAWEIQREYGLTPFAYAEPELRAWIADQAWLTGEGPKAVFSGAVARLRGLQALLPAWVV